MLLHNVLHPWPPSDGHLTLPRIGAAVPRQMLPAVYRFIGASWEATPTQLGYITLSRALVQALSSPIGGIAGGLGRGSVWMHLPARRGGW